MKHFLTDAQVAEITSKKISWSGSAAKCGHIFGSYSWGDGVISWSVMGEGKSIRMAVQNDKGIDSAAAKLESIARAEIEKLIMSKAEEIQREFINK
jgi:hypothetical protein